VGVDEVQLPAGQQPAGHVLGRARGRGLRLYTFTGDSGHSVNGNGVAGFHVAKVITTCAAAR